MRTLSIMVSLITLAVGLASASSPQGAQSPSAGASRAKIDLTRGWADYQRYCKNCHGEQGKGDGAIAKWLKVPPADLTQVSENHDGEFPEEKLVRVIDGREEVRVHGLREMPIWGDVFQDGEAPGKSESSVQQKIADLVAVVRSMDQPKRAPGSG
jgi:mono/diheme cytochrome c family protein